jgi:hypothetical protein
MVNLWKYFLLPVLSSFSELKLLHRKKNFTFIFVVFLSAQTLGQEVNMGADLVSRYVLRGLEVANTPSMQPTLSVALWGFETGVWGAYTLSNNTSASDEINIWLGYNITSDAGNFSFSVIDYYFPNSGKKIGNFKNDEGAHTLEGTFTYCGPISLLVACNFYNDPGNNIYFEFGYSFTADKIEFELYAGGTPGSKDNPGFYGAENFSMINIGVTASKKIKITDDYEFPIFTSFIVNPRAEVAHIVFGITF